VSGHNNFQYDVFLSHNRAQKAWTRDLARRLRDDGFKVWFDEWELPKRAGKDWIAMLVEGVEESRKVVLVLSPEFLANEWPEFESRVVILRDPVGRKERIVPIVHTSCKLPGEFAFRQALDFTIAHIGTLESDFCYQQLAYNLDTSRPFEGDIEEFRQARGKPDADAIPPVRPLPKGSRMPHGNNPLFVGRENEFRQLARALTPGSGAAVGVHAAVTGMGGVGKTHLAIEYVHRYGHLYSAGVFWLDMEKSDDAQNQVARCGGPEGVNLQGFGGMSLPDQAATVQAMWEDGRTALLVFDNVPEPSLVDHWRPKTGRCALLVTSRHCNWPPELGVRSLPVETLPRPRSIEYLAKARPEIESDDAQHDVADQICAQLGDLPLALRVAAAYLQRYKQERLAEYLQALRKQPALLDESLKDVAASFALSYYKLDPEDPTDALAIKLFHLASHFAPVSIARELLAASASLDYSQRAEQHQVDDALSRLRDLALVSEEPDDRVLLHRLLRDFARLRPPRWNRSGRECGSRRQRSSRLCRQRKRERFAPASRPRTPTPPGSHSMGGEAEPKFRRSLVQLTWVPLEDGGCLPPGQSRLPARPQNRRSHLRTPPP
jgi:hypothetical protein